MVLRLILIFSCMSIYAGVSGYQIHHFIFYPTLLYYLFFGNTKISELTYFLPLPIFLFFTLFSGKSLDLGNLEMYMFFGSYIFLTGKLNEIELQKLKSAHLQLTTLLVLTILIQFLGFDITEYIGFQNPNSDLAERSLRNFRYVGVFGSPFEAGVICFILLWFGKNKINIILLILVFISGILTLSKAFILGIPFLLFRYDLIRFKLRNIIIFSTIFSIIFFFGIYFIEYWSGIKRLVDILTLNSKNNSVIDLLFAGRYGSEDSVVSSRLSLYNFIVPNGFVTSDYPLDSLIIYCQHAFGIYGIPLLISIYYSFYKFNKKLCLYLVLASLGAPLIFKNYIAQALAIHTKLNK
jgi:hypothetical protein